MDRKKCNKILEDIEEMDDGYEMCSHIVKSLDVEELTSFVGFLMVSLDKQQKKIELLKQLLKEGD